MRHNNISSQHINLFCAVIEGVSQERHVTTLWNKSHSKYFYYNNSGVHNRYKSTKYIFSGK